MSRGQQRDYLIPGYVQGYLELISSYRENRQTMLNFLCRVCNKEFTISLSKFSTISKTCGGPGCRNYSTKKDPYLRTISTRLSHYERNAKLRGYSFELKEEDVKKLIFAKFCHYCGDAPSIEPLGYRHLKINTIDRYDNTVGYKVGNCVPCCDFCNTLKSNKSAESLISWIKKVIAVKEGSDNG